MRLRYTVADRTPLSLGFTGDGDDRSRQDLKTLASIFEPRAVLYEVGGCVRDRLLSVGGADIDICSKLRVEDVKTLLSNADFEVLDKNMRLGTLHIRRGSRTYEYTAFRTDSYRRERGNHCPSSVRFTSDISADALRRDFTCNAVYYDILRDRYVDLLGGVEDIERRLLRTVDEPEKVFEADGLRILRLVRFAAELGFEPEGRTLEVAKSNSWRVKDIAAERIRDELKKIFVADERHPELGLKGAHVKGLRLLDELGLIDLLLPEVAALKGLAQPVKYHKFDAFEHSVKTFEAAAPQIRWAALLHDVGKAPAMKSDGNMYAHAVYGEGMVTAILARLKFSTAEAERISRLVGCHMADVGGNTSEAKLRRFIVRHADIIDDLCLLMDADAYATKELPHERNRLRWQLEFMRSEGLPLKIADLKVDGRDLIALGAPEKQRGRLLCDLLEETALNPLLNDREKAIKYLTNRIDGGPDGKRG